MARRAGVDIYRVNVRGAGRVAADFDRMARTMQDEMIRELRRFGVEAVETYRGQAPADTQDLQDAIDAVAFLKAIRPRLSVRVAPLLGHRGEQHDDTDYLRVVRFGHRRGTLTPRRARALKVHYAGHRNAEVYEFRSFVPGAGPAGGSDFVERAGPLIEKLADGAEVRLGRRIERRLIR